MRRLTVVTVVLAAVFVVVGIGTPLLGITVFAGTDLMMVRAPWSYLVPTGFQPQNVYVADTVDGFLPATHEFVERLRAGDFAQWWPYNSGGAQLGSVPNQALLTPLSLPYLLLPLELAPAYVKLLETAVAIAGTYLFLRRLELAKAACVLGGLVFVSSGFMIAWTNWPQTRVAALIPALFWALERTVQRRRLADAAVVAAVVAVMLLGGFPAVTWYALVAGAVYCIVRVLGPAERAARPAVGVLALAGAGVALGVCLAAAQLLPFLQELEAVSTGNREQAAGAHSPVETLVLTFAPDAYGGPSLGTQVRWFGPSNPVEEMSYVGAAALVLVGVAVLARRRPGMPRGVRAYFVLASLATLVLVFVGGPLLDAVQQLPVFGANRMGRARSVLGFFVAVLAAVGFDALLRAPVEVSWSARRRRVWRSAGVLVWVVAAAGVAVVVFLARRVSYAGGEPAYFQAAMLRAGLFCGLAATAVVVASRGRGAVKWTALAAVPALVAAQALTVVLAFWPRVAPEQFYPQTPTHQFLAGHLGADRLVTTGTMMTGTEAYYRLRTSGGRGFVSAGYAELLQVGCPSCFVSPTYLSAPRNPLAADPDVLDRLATRYRVDDPSMPVPGDRELLGDGLSRVELEPGDPVEVALPPGGLRAVGVVAAAAHVPTDPMARLTVVLRDAAGTVVVETDRRLMAGVLQGAVLAAVPEAAAAAAATATITLVDDAALPVRADGSAPSVLLVRPPGDGLEVVAVGAATIYERLTALPRIRWASSAVVEADARTAAGIVSSGNAPEVVLSAPGPEPSGLPGDVQVHEDGGDVLEVAVDADGGGYLVVADALQERWTAELDGDPAELRAADVGLVAVWVPAGQHVVRFAYEPPAGGAGYAISALAGALVVGLVPADRWLARRRRRGTADRPEPPDGSPPAAASADEGIEGAQASARR